MNDVRYVDAGKWHALYINHQSVFQGKDISVREFIHFVNELKNTSAYKHYVLTVAGSNWMEGEQSLPQDFDMIMDH